MHRNRQQRKSSAGIPRMVVHIRLMQVYPGLHTANTDNHDMCGLGHSGLSCSAGASHELTARMGATQSDGLTQNQKEVSKTDRQDT